MKMKFTKYGLVASGALAFSLGQADAATMITATTKATGGTISVDNGASISSSGSAASGTSTTLIMSYTVSGLDLSAEEPGATSVSFDFTVTYSSNSADFIAFSGGGSVGIDNTQVNGSELLSIGVSSPANIVGFSGAITLDGIVSAQLANFNNTTEQHNLALSDSTNIVLVGPSDTGTAPAGSVAGDTALIPASQGITGFDQSALSGAAGFRTL